MIGGKGRRKTLRLAAQHAQIVNFTSADPEELTELLDVLRRHCDDVGTDYDAIEKQALAARLNPDAPDWLDQVKRLRDLGIDLVVLSVRPNRQLEWVERLANDVVPRIAEV
jgi:alkanesulfonate monooxygenase SsuD/methylene tetrahydromethanopterin reductase-like flavin-dependent oxidoreductase (luciferase family)